MKDCPFLLEFSATVSYAGIVPAECCVKHKAKAVIISSFMAAACRFAQSSIAVRHGSLI